MVANIYGIPIAYDNIIYLAFWNCKMNCTMIQQYLHKDIALYKYFSYQQHNSSRKHY